MPGFDGTGPRGMGPMTGGGRGFCSPWGIGAALRGGAIPPYPGVPYAPYGGAMPYGWAMPYARPMPYGGATPFAPQTDPKQDLEYLRNQAQVMRKQLEEIESRIRELGE